MVMLASEMGVLPFEESKIVTKWRLQPGKMLLIDLEKGRIISDQELKADLSKLHPYQEWLEKGQIKVRDLPAVPHEEPKHHADLLDRQQAVGVTSETIKFLLEPMASVGQ